MPQNHIRKVERHVILTNNFASEPQIDCWHISEKKEAKIIELMFNLKLWMTAGNTPEYLNLFKSLIRTIDLEILKTN